MKRLSHFAITALFAASAFILSTGSPIQMTMTDDSRLTDKELGIGEYSEQAYHGVPRLDDKELGIGDYSEQAYNASPRLDDQELGIGDFSEHA